MKISVCAKRPILTECRLENFNFQIDPYIGCEHNCYYCYVLPQAETDWTKEILIHEDIVRQLEEELEDITPQVIYMGYYSDPYQQSEEQYLQTRKTLELLQSKGFSVSILTKSDLVLRDIDILKEMKDPFVSVSLAFNDNRTRRLFEANTMDTERRMEALCLLKEAGIKTGALICPVIPYITDPVKIIESVKDYADTIWVYPLNFGDRSGKNFKNIHKILHSEFPSQSDQIEKVVFSKEHSSWNQLRERLFTLKADLILNMHIHV